MSCWLLTNSSLFETLVLSIYPNNLFAYSPDWAKLYFKNPEFHFTKLITQVSNIDAPISIYKRLIGVKFLLFLLKIINTFLTRLVLILVGSISINSSLKVIEFINSFAIVQLGAMQPLRIQTIFKTFSTKWFGFIYFLKFIMCYFVSCLIEISVILIAY